MFRSAEPPGPPRGPLEVSGMTKTSFTIKWEPPENDGGTPITDYIIEIKETSKKAWRRVSITRTRGEKIFSNKNYVKIIFPSVSRKVGSY